jgi:pimeloyl-ACP methyl ester carboxylesterase
LASLPTPVALAWSTSTRAQSTSEGASGEVADPTGVYFSNGRSIGISPFINDAGEQVFLFTEYKSGKVRSLFLQSNGTFTFGPGFSVASPIEGTLRLDGPDSLTLTPALGSSVRATRIRTRDVPVSFAGSDATLSGTLIVPPGPGPHPAIVLLHGSGPLTRYSFGPYPRFFSSLGLAVLFYDKRGTGASTGIRLDASTGRPDVLSPAFYPDDLREDAAAAVRMLRDRPEIDPRRIGLWGSSEGGMLTTQVAAHDPQIAFIINSVGFMGVLADTILYQGAAKMRAAGKSDAEIAQAVAFNRMWMEAGRTGDGFADFVAQRERVVADGKTDWLFYEEAGFTSQEQVTWAMKHILDFDSLPDVSRVRCPALGLFGEKDVLTDSQRASAAMLQALRSGGNADATVKVVPNATHSLMEASPRAHMAPGVFDTLMTWLLPRIRQGQGATG